MSHVRIILSLKAIADLEDIEEPLLSKVIERVQLLSEFPSLGSPMEKPFLGRRMLVVDIFKILYRVVSPTRIEVLYIRHAKRQL